MLKIEDTKLLNRNLHSCGLTQSYTTNFKYSHTKHILYYRIQSNSLHYIYLNSQQIYMTYFIIILFFSHKNKQFTRFIFYRTFARKLICVETNTRKTRYHGLAHTNPISRYIAKHVRNILQCILQRQLQHIYSYQMTQYYIFSLYIISSRIL